MTKIFKNIKLKNYLYEVIEVIYYYCQIFLLFLLFSWFKIDTYRLPTSQFFETILSQFPHYSIPDSAAIHLQLFTLSIAILSVNLLVILIKKTTTLNWILSVEFENNGSGWYILKFFLYEILKFVSVVIYLASTKIDTQIFFYYKELFFYYFVLNLIVRVATKGQRSILFYILNLKNV